MRVAAAAAVAAVATVVAIDTLRIFVVRIFVGSRDSIIKGGGVMYGRVLCYLLSHPKRCPLSLPFLHISRLPPSMHMCVQCKHSLAVKLAEVTGDVNERVVDDDVRFIPSYSAGSVYFVRTRVLVLVLT
jgi:hypothetical protein